MYYSTKCIKYNANVAKGFQDSLNDQVDAYFKKINSHKKANALMWFKVFLFFGLFWLVWYQLVFHAHSTPVIIILVAAQILLFKCVAYNVAHDAVHGALSDKKWVNDIVYKISFNTLGPNAYLWKIRHNNAHHFCTNIPNGDFDIEATQVIRFSPHKAWKPFHRYQHLYAPILYMIFTIHWILIKDFKMFFLKEFGNVVDLKHSKWRLVEMIFFKIFYIGNVIIIPAIFSPYNLGQILITFVSFQFCLSFLVTMTFVASHVGLASIFVEQDSEGNLPHSFIEHALHTSIDFHPTSPIIGFFYGGFNAHVAHHVYPNISSIHYGPLTKIIQDTCRKFGMPYHQMSLPNLFISHFKFLKKLGSSSHAAVEHLLSQSR